MWTYTVRNRIAVSWATWSAGEIAGIGVWGPWWREPVSPMGSMS